MTRELSLEELVRRGESQTLEFKKSLSLQREGLEALCAMVNSDLAKGTVVFGIEPNGTVCGIEQGNFDKAQRSLSQTLRSKFEPQLTAQISIEELSDKTVLVISAERHRSIPYHEYDGRAWVRQGSENLKLRLDEKKLLARKRDRDSHRGPWQCDRCGAMVLELTSVEITDGRMRRTYKCECGGEFWPVT